MNIDGNDDPKVWLSQPVKSKDELKKEVIPVTVLLFVGALAALLIVTGKRSLKVRVWGWIIGVICLVGFLMLVGTFH